MYESGVADWSKACYGESELTKFSNCGVNVKKSLELTGQIAVISLTSGFAVTNYVMTTLEGTGVKIGICLEFISLLGLFTSPKFRTILS